MGYLVNLEYPFKGENSNDFEVLLCKKEPKIIGRTTTHYGTGMIFVFGR